MKKVKNCLKMPNAIIDDQQLTYSAKQVAAVIYSYSNALGYCRLGLVRVARRARCAVSTAAQAVQQLVERGYIASYKNYGWSHQAGRMVYKNYTYVCLMNLQREFTFVPREALHCEMRKSTFALYLQLRRFAGNAFRAFPSLNQICAALCMAKATVCRAITELVNVGLVHLEHCVKRNHCHACNSYFFARKTETQNTQAPRPADRFQVKVVCKPERVDARKVALLRSFHMFIIKDGLYKSKPFIAQGVVSFLTI